MAAVTRETTAWETTARVGRGDYRPADKLMSPTNRVFPRNNKVWAHEPMSLKFDGPFL